MNNVRTALTAQNGFRASHPRRTFTSSMANRKPFCTGKKFINLQSKSILNIEQPFGATLNQQKITNKRHKSAVQIRRRPLFDTEPGVQMTVNLEQILKLNDVYVDLMNLIKQREYTGIFNKCSQWWDTTADNIIPFLNVII